MRCNQMLLNISYKDHVTNEEVPRKIQAAIREYDELLTMVTEQTHRWFGQQGWQKGGKYSYFPGWWEILVIPGNYW